MITIVRTGAPARGRGLSVAVHGRRGGRQAPRGRGGAARRPELADLLRVPPGEGRRDTARGQGLARPVGGEGAGPQDARGGVEGARVAEEVFRHEERLSLVRLISAFQL